MSPSSVVGAVLLLVCSFSACRSGSDQGPSATQSSEAASSLPAQESRLVGITLPKVINCVDLEPGVPEVLVRSGRIFVDGAPAGDLTALVGVTALKRIQPLFDALTVVRDAWKTKHPGTGYHGNVLLVMDAGLDAIAAKSVFQTAALSGHPEIGFLVASEFDPSKLGRIVVDAVVPGPPPGEEIEEAPPKVFAVSLESKRGLSLYRYRGHALLTRLDFSLPLAPVTQMRAGLARRAELEWKEQGEHREPGDAKFDSARVRVTHDLTFGDIIAVFDALGEPKRQARVGGSLRTVPAFQVVFSIAQPNVIPEAG